MLIALLKIIGLILFFCFGIFLSITSLFGFRSLLIELINNLEPHRVDDYFIYAFLPFGFSVIILLGSIGIMIDQKNNKQSVALPGYILLCTGYFMLVSTLCFVGYYYFFRNASATSSLFILILILPFGFWHLFSGFHKLEQSKKGKQLRKQKNAFIPR